MQDDFLVTAVREVRESLAINRAREYRLGVIAIEADGNLAAFQRVPEIVDDERQNRTLISLCPESKYD